MVFAKCLCLEFRTTHGLIVWGFLKLRSLLIKPSICPCHNLLPCLSFILFSYLVYLSSSLPIPKRLAFSVNCSVYLPNSISNQIHQQVKLVSQEKESPTFLTIQGSSCWILHIFWMRSYPKMFLYYPDAPRAYSEQTCHPGNNGRALYSCQASNICSETALITCLHRLQRGQAPKRCPSGLAARLGDCHAFFRHGHKYLISC